jgi:hypothetical protein
LETKGLGACYAALTVGRSHNYYLGRAEADITPWIAYFIEGMADSFEKLRDQAVREAAGTRQRCCATWMAGNAGS